MPATEDSVLTSLNELRRLRKERQKKGHPGRGASGRPRKHVATSHDPMGDEVTPPPRTDLLPVAKGGRHGGHSAHAVAAKPAPASPALIMPPVAATWDNPMAVPTVAQMAKPSSSAKPAIIVALLLLAGAGAGYVKLQNDTRALIAEKDAEIRRVEEARAQAVEAAAKAERQAQIKLKACESKVEAAVAAPTPVGSTAVAVVSPLSPSPSVSPSSSIPTSFSSSNKRVRHKEKASAGGRRAASASTGSAPAEETSAVPNLPRKKKLDNDPLAGIKI